MRRLPPRLRLRLLPCWTSLACNQSTFLPPRFRSGLLVPRNRHAARMARRLLWRLPTPPRLQLPVRRLYLLSPSIYVSSAGALPPALLVDPLPPAAAYPTLVVAASRPATPPTARSGRSHSFCGHRLDLPPPPRVEGGPAPSRCGLTLGSPLEGSVH